MLHSRGFRYTAAGALVMLVLFGAWTAYQASQVNEDLDDAAQHVEAIQRAAEARDAEAIDRELDGLREASARATARTSGTGWSALTYLPVLGDDAEGVQLTSMVLQDLARDGLAPLAEVAGRIETFLPRDGAVDAAAIRELQEPVDMARIAFADADRTLSAVDASGFTERLRAQFVDFRDQVHRAGGAMDTASIATELLPGMLGVDEPRHYLLVFQNNAEIRGTGGLAGAASSIVAADGKLAIERHVTGSSLGEAPKPVLPLTAAERELYGDVLGTYFLNAGMTPDVPRAADLLRARWEREFPRRPVDGVLLVDAVAISYLLEATGPVTVDGRRLTTDNVVDELLHESYLRLPNPKDQDAFFAAAAAAAFERFTSGIEDSTAMVRALSRSTDEGRVFIHSFHEDEQGELAGTAIAGEFGTDPSAEEPQVGVTLNDTTGAKMSYFLRYDVDVSATSCVDGVQTYAAKARVRSTAPKDAADLPDYVTGGGQFGIPPGTQLVTVRIYGPAGGSIGDLDWNGAPMDLVRVTQDSRPVGMTYVELQPGQTVDLAWTMKSGDGQTGDTAVTVTPTIDDTDNARMLASACGAKEN